VTEREPAWYESCASELLEPLGDRWLHVEAVGRCAENVASEWLPLEDRSDLIAAAWLHDIGYAPQIASTGFHPLDGARHLRTIGVDDRVVALVAHHSCARFEAELRGLGRALDAFPQEQSVVADALTYADMVTGPSGQPLTVDQRLADIFERYREGSVVHTAIGQAAGELRAAVLRTEARLESHEARRTG
jgi:putative nucleotidyltransferase with HDIG domain